jgi:endonuclease G, mitochondrial
MRSRFRDTCRVVLAVLAMAAVAVAQPPIEPTLDYQHNRFGTYPPDHVVEFQAYVSSFDTSDDDNDDGIGDLWGVPEWVAYELRAGAPQGEKSKPRSWRQVPDLPDDTPSPTDASYKNSGYSRGHMCMRSHAHRLGSAANYHTFNVANACPQIQPFNGGHWLGLENLTAKWADRYGAVWIVCGPIFDDRDVANNEQIGDGSEIRVAIPDAFFKIVAKDPSEPGPPDVLAFIHRHDPNLNSSGDSVDHTPFLKSVREVEEATGLDFFTALSADVQDAIEVEAATALWSTEAMVAPLATLADEMPRAAEASSAAEASAATSAPKYVNGVATFIPDGDTVHVRQDGRVYKIRFHGVDCPESDQNYGIKAQEFTEKMVEGEPITVKVVERDRWGRLVGEVFVDGRSVNRELARAGLAWWYARYAGDDLDIKRLVEAAREEQRGLWSQDNPIAPWDWRHN